MLIVEDKMEAVEIIQKIDLLPLTQKMFIMEKLFILFVLKSRKQP
jgi:hypothetical protein